MVPLSISKLICSRSIIEFLQFWFVPFSCDGLMLDIDGQVRHAPSKSSKLIYQQLSLKPHHEQFTSPILRGYNDLTWHVSWLRIQIPQSWFPTGIITYNLYYMYIYIVYMCVWNMPPVIHTYSSTTPRNTPRYFRCLGAAPGSFSGAIPWGMAWNWCETGDKSSTSFGPDCADDISASSNNMMNI